MQSLLNILIKYILCFDKAGVGFSLFSAAVTNFLLLGCENVCFNEFAPISNVRLWGLQLLGIVLNIIGSL